MIPSWLRRFLAVTHARNIEFMRDRTALGWNILLPVLIVLGMALIFSGVSRPLFTVALVETEGAPLVHPFLDTPHIRFLPVPERDRALRKLERHQLDMVIEAGGPEANPATYWVNPASAKGTLVERLLLAAQGARLAKESVSGDAVRYVDWLAPGVLGMNMMFSCLFGVGFVVVRYRKNGFLKRLNATPLAAIEFVSAQIASRLLLIMVITLGVYLGVDAFLDLRMEGSYAALLVVTLLGAISMIAMGFLVSARVTSEELASGLLNLLSWPMMLLSGVWFSLDRAPAWVLTVAEFFPLTQLLKAARTIMVEGGGLLEVSTEIAALVAMTTAFLVIGAWTFRWQGA